MGLGNIIRGTLLAGLTVISPGCSSNQVEETPPEPQPVAAVEPAPAENLEQKTEPVQEELQEIVHKKYFVDSKRWLERINNETSELAQLCELYVSADAEKKEIEAQIKSLYAKHHTTANNFAYAIAQDYDEAKLGLAIAAGSKKYFEGKLTRIRAELKERGELTAELREETKRTIKYLTASSSRKVNVETELVRVNTLLERFESASKLVSYYGAVFEEIGERLTHEQYMGQALRKIEEVDKKFGNR